VYSSNKNKGSVGFAFENPSAFYFSPCFFSASFGKEMFVAERFSVKCWHLRHSLWAWLLSS
jgi:hypothetical protein